MARIVVMYGTKHEQTIGLDVPNLLIGRGDDTGLQVSNQTVSRHHCRVELDGNRHVLVDLDSTSGTFLNGNKIDRPVTLQHRDKIELGKHTLIYERDAVETGNAPILDESADESDAGASQSGSGTDFWAAGLKESGFQADGPGSSGGMPAADGDSAPWEQPKKPASELAAEKRQAQADNYAGTMLASEGEMKRIRETLLKQQKPHLAVVVKGDRQIVPMEVDTITVGYYDGADFRLEGSRFFGKKQFLITASGKAWMVKPGSMFAKVHLKGKRIKGPELLTGGEVIQAAGLKFKFNKGE